MTQIQELKSRFEAKKKQLEADLAKARANAQGKSNDAADKIEAKLKELRSSVGSTWENLSEDAARKLNDWLARN